MTSYKRTVIVSAIFFVAALVVRLAYVHQFVSTPFFDPKATGLDPLAFDEMARGLASGDWIGTGVFELMPGYGYLLGVIYTIFGHSFSAAYALQAFLSASSILFLYLLAKRLTKESVAIVAAVGGILCQSLIFHTGMLTGETLAVFLSVSMLLVLTIAMERGKTLYFLITGFITGFGVLTRGTFAIFAVLFAGWYLITERRQLISKALPHCLAFVLGVILVVAPVTLKNALVGNDFVLVTAHDGINFYLGNNPHARGGFQPVPELGLHRQEMLINAKIIAENNEGKELKPSAVSRYWKKRTFQFIGNYPLRFLELIGEKTLAFVNAYEISDVISMETMKRFSTLLRFGTLPLGVIVPFALFGMILAIRRKAFTPLYLFVAANLLAVIITLVNARYRLTVLPPLLIFTGLSVVWLRDNFRYRWKFIGGTITIILAFMVVYQPLIAGAEPAVDAYNLANAYMHTGEPKLAEEEYQRALEHNPNYLDARFGLGMLYWGKRMANEAEREFLYILKSKPNHVDSLNQMGNISLFKDDKTKALEYWQQSLSINPDQPEVKAAIEHNKLK